MSILVDNALAVSLPPLGRFTSTLVSRYAFWHLEYSVRRISSSISYAESGCIYYVEGVGVGTGGTCPLSSGTSVKLLCALPNIATDFLGSSSGSKGLSVTV